jgi:Ca2+-transporting ATPase
MDWHAITVTDVVKSVDTDLTHGLTAAEAQGRLARAGPNRLPAPHARSWPRRIAAQTREFFVILLTVAALISWLLGQRLDASAIFLIVILNIALGAVQEARAEQALAALRNLAAPQAEVVRDGIPLTIPAETLVPGDIVLLATGARVPADLRLVAAHTLTVDESLLTGESLAVGKDETPVPPDTPLAERHNLVFLGTAVATGRGRGVVVGTGGNTELGALARSIEAAPPRTTPLAARLGVLGRAVGAVALGVCVLVFAVGVARGRAVFEMFLVATSLAVAAVPEGLPAAVTVALALGVQRMARQRAIVRRLPAVETLGSVTVVCTDKTGTLTLNELAVRRIDAAGHTVDVTGAGYAPIGELLMEGTPVHAPAVPWLRMLLEAAVLSSDGGVVQEQGRWRPHGDPLEAAFVAAAMKAGLVPSAVREGAPRVGEVPFTPERKRTLTVHRTRQGLVVYLKGAPEAMLPMCTAWEGPDGPQAFDDRAREMIRSRGEALAAQGMRVVALARGAVARIDRGALASPAMLDAVERDAVLLGFIGLADPVRPEAAAAIAEARRAGVRPVMITGDHPRTALAVAREVGLDDTGSSLSGVDLDRLSDRGLDGAVASCSVFARATPEHKVRILRALKARGEVVAMTGDGANDAPALAQADVGIAMGRAGTDVAREAADVVLTDDNFATIVAAIREGRTIFENIRKFVLYVLASNVGEVAVVLGATLVAPSAVLTPIQILWINLVTDGLPSAALAVDPQEPGVMARRPRPAGAGPVASGGLAFLVAFGLVIAGVCCAAYLWAAAQGEPPAQRRTVVFLTLSLSQLLFAFACRSSHHPALGREFVRNPWLLASVGLSVALQLLVVTLPGARVVFSASPLRGGDWAVVAGLSSVPLIASELFKYLRRVREPRTC